MTNPKKKNHGGRRKGAGRPPSGKVKLTCHVTPETRAKLGDKPGEAIDKAFSEPNDLDHPPRLGARAATDRHE